jgi:hypothetical protein
MGSSEFVAVAGAVAAVLSVVGGTLRYLVRMAQSMEQTSTRVAAMGESFAKHVDSSDELHRALADRVTQHGEQLAALTVRVTGMQR